MRSKTQLTLVAALVLVVVSASGCTGRREAKFPDGAGENLIEISTLQNAEINLTTGRSKLVGGADSDAVPVESLVGPDVVRPMFKDLKITATPGETYPVRIKLSPTEGLTAYRVINDRSELNAIDDALAEVSELNEILVPIFNFPIRAYGTVVRAKNDLGEETDTLRFSSTEWDQATHIQVSSLVADRLGFQLEDGEKKNTFRRDLIDGARVELATGDVRPMGKVEVTSSNAPTPLRFMFENFVHSLPAQDRVEVVLKLQARNKPPVVRAFRVIKNVSALSSIEKQMLEPRAKPSDPALLPIFEFPVSRMGVIKRRTSKGVRSASLELEETEAFEAKQIQVEALSKYRKPIELERDTRQELFERASLDHAVMTKAEIKDKLGVKLAGIDENPNARMAIRVDGRKLSIYSLSDADPVDLARLGRDPRVMRCTDAVKEKVLEVRDCLMVRQFEVELDYVRVEFSEDRDGNRTGEVRVKSGLTAKDTELVQVRRGSTPREVGEEHDPRNMVAVAQVAGSEYLMRRTMQDSPNGFDNTFPGANAEPEITRFVFEEKGMRVVRADAIRKIGGSTDLDRETLMYIPAAYFRRETTDSQGNPLASPRYVPVKFDGKIDGKTVAYLDWSANRIPTVASPMSYYQLSCFSPTGVDSVLDMDQRLASPEGILNFTLSTTYAAAPDASCLGIYSAGSFSVIHANYTFEERISFKRYEKNDEKPQLAIPYLAQKALGFGLFTFGKSNPTAGGTTGTTKTEIPLPSLWDIRGGKKIRYVLAGIPPQGEEREAIIKATEEVVADWNAAFRKALAGTPMERADDVLELQVEGRELTPEQAGKIGDLDKNHIYYVQKISESGVLGIGGNSANPRSGRVENGSLYIYGGNIRSTVEYLRKTESARKAYHAIVDKIEPLPSPAPADGATGGTGEGDGPLGGLAERLRGSRFEKTVSEAIKPEVKTGAALTAAIRDYADRMRSTSARDVGDLDERISLIKALTPEQKAIYQALKKGAETGALRDRSRMSQLVMQAQLKEMDSVLSPEEKAELSMESRRVDANAKFRASMQKAGLCLIDRQEMGGLREVEGKTDLELHVETYKWVLAHEMGHNLGLRHNFIGSFDKRNWLHEGETGSKRDYSSIMDYLERHDHYAGLGPQDVHAIRTAYAGVFELHPQVQKQIAERGLKELPLPGGPTAGTLKIVNGRFVDVEGYRKYLGLPDWYALTQNTSVMGRLPIRQFSFCSDEDVGYNPVCNRFDQGTSPAEIVRNVADQYRSYYSLRNFAGDRIRFGLTQTAGYVNSLIGTFLQARVFLEETFYVLNEIRAAGLDPETANRIINTYASGAAEALFFFHEVARTPDAPAAAVGDQRFVKVQTPKGIATIERKWLTSSGERERLRVRGIELDKAFAMLMLTNRGFGFPKYIDSSMRVSFLDFEQVTGLGSELPGGGFTLNLMQGVLEDEVMPMVQIPGQGPMFLTVPGFVARTNDIHRMFAITSAVIRSDIDGMRAADNPASLFRVFGGLTAPRGVLNVTYPDANRGEKKYWAFEQASNASEIIKSIALRDRILAVKPKLRELVRQWVALQMGVELKKEAEGEGEGDPATPGTEPTPPQEPKPLTPEEIAAKSKELETQIDAILGQLPEEVGPRTMADASGVIGQLVNIGVEITKSGRAPNPLSIDSTRTQVEHMIREAPIFGVLLESIPAQEIKLPILGQIIPSGRTEQSRGIRFRNVQTMNEALLAIHPDMARQ